MYRGRTPFAIILTANTALPYSYSAETGNTICYLGHIQVMHQGHHLELKSSRNYLLIIQCPNHATSYLWPLGVDIHTHVNIPMSAQICFQETSQALQPAHLV